MRVIICGAGQVGYNIAAYLAEEDNDVTVVDQDPTLIAQVNEDLDVNGIVGFASNPDVLNGAHAKDADMIIAVTRSDEVNMVACQIGHSLFGIPKKIARIREQAYLQPAWANLFSRSHMPIDVIISPEVVVAEDIYRRLSVPGTTYVSSMADGLVHLLGVVCHADCPLVNTQLGQIRSLFPDLTFKIVAIMRKGHSFIVGDEDEIEVGDEVFFLVDTHHLKRTMIAFGFEEETSRRIVIAGGGNVGYRLVELLQQRGRGVQVKMIEHNTKRAQFLSENLDNVVVLHGSSLDKAILDEASVGDVGTFIAVTNDDESNILSSLLAKQYGCGRVITLVSNNAYSPLVGPLGVDAMVSPRSIIVSTVMQHVRRGRIKEIQNLRDGFAEVIEAEVSEAAQIVNTPLAELILPHEIDVCAIIREGEVLLPDPEEIVRAGDTLIVIASQENAQDVEKMFSVQVDLF